MNHIDLTTRRGTTRSLLLAATAFTFSTAAWAQDAAGSAQAEGASSAEIIVTANKREQSLQDVGITMDAFSSDQMAERGIVSVDSLATSLPGVESQDDVAGQAHYRIRGIGLNEFQATFDAPVGVHVDEVILGKPFLASMGFFDVDRVEVLRGPQGTVFGRNTTAGAINYYSRKPTEEFSGHATLTGANYRRVEFESAVSGGLGGNFSGRLAVQAVNQDKGEYFNLYDGKDVGGIEDKLRVRATLRWKNDATDAILSAHYGTHGGQLTPYDNLFQNTPGGPADVSKQIRNPIAREIVNQDYFPIRDNRASGINFKLAQDLGFATLTSITAYEYFERDQREDSDNTPTATVNIDWYSSDKQFSQELRLDGTIGMVDFLVGAYYYTDKVENLDTIDVGPVRLGDDFLQKTRSFALFTNNDLHLTDQLSLTLGARWTTERISVKGASYVATGQGVGRLDRVDPATYLDAYLSDRKRTDSDFNFRFGFNYQPSSDVTVYGSYSTGFRSGGFDVGFYTPLIEFKPESVKAFELGARASMMDGAVRVNLAAFHTRVSDYQANANLPTELAPRRRNVGELTSKGLEGEISLRPAKGLLIEASGAYNDVEITKSTFLIGTIPILGNTEANTPKYSTNLFVSYKAPVSDSLEWGVSGNWSWTDKRYLEIENQPDHLVPAYSLLDARLTLGHLDDKWSVSLWGKNLANKRYLRYLNDVPGFGLYLPINGDFRTYGLTFNYNF